MKDYSQYTNQTEEEIRIYNKNLWLSFSFNADKFLSLISREERQKLSQSFDLLKAINNYRKFKTVNELILHSPELKEQKKYIDLLWGHFQKLNEEELSELAIQMIHEVSI